MHCFKTQIDVLCALPLMKILNRPQPHDSPTITCAPQHSNRVSSALDIVTLCIETNVQTCDRLHHFETHLSRELK